jgi:hypothetical protein
MLTDREREAVTLWYSEDRVLENAKRLVAERDYQQLEEYLHKTALFPLGKHDQLPDYMRDDEGKPLFATNLDPRADEDKWQDAIEVAWEVIHLKFGISHNDIHRKLATEQDRDWDAFIKSVEERKKQRGAS